MTSNDIVDIADIDLRRFISPGDQITWAQLIGEPLTLTEALNAQLPGLGGISAIVGMTITDSIADEMLSHIRFRSFSGAATNQRFIRHGQTEILPIQLCQIPALMASGRLRVDVVMFGVAADDGGAQVSTGIVCDFLPEAIAKARVVIGEVNETMPWTSGDTEMARSEFDLLVRARHPVIEMRPRELSDIDRAIADNIARLVSDRAVLQFGIGGVPDAVLASLGDKRELGIHTGILTEPVQHLIECGAVTNRYKPIDEGQCIAALLSGSRDFYRFCHRNPALHMRRTSYTHDAGTLAHFDNLIAINSAFEVDLTGQVNAETVGGRHLGQVGGQVDFVRAGSRAVHGHSVIGLPSTTRDGKRSRIVAGLSDGVATTLRTDTDLVVTEYGMAELPGLTLEERAKALIEIAHPDFRKALTAEVDRLC